MTLRCHARGAIHRSAEANAHSPHIMLFNQPRRNTFNLLQNACRASSRINIQPYECSQLAATTVAHAQLQLRTADFDAQIHACYLSPESTAHRALGTGAHKVELTRSKNPNRRMRPSFNWQPLLLIASFSLAVAFALGGWTLGRWRSREHVEAANSELTNQSTANLPGPVDAKDPHKSIATPNSEGSILLDPSRATLHGAVTRSLTAGEDGLVGWSSLQDSATWQFRSPKPGFYSAEFTYATTDAAAEAELE